MQFKLILAVDSGTIERTPLRMESEDGEDGVPWVEAMAKELVSLNARVGGCN